MVNPAEILQRENCSCVICHGEDATICHGRGISDLYRIYTENPQLLLGAWIADKVIGKGAAALMIVGGAVRIYAQVISMPAKILIDNAGISLEYSVCVPNIINRDGTGICPVEKLCEPCATANECLPMITKFVTEIKPKLFI